MEIYFPRVASLQCKQSFDVEKNSLATHLPHSSILVDKDTSKSHRNYTCGEPFQSPFYLVLNLLRDTNENSHISIRFADSNIA